MHCPFCARIYNGEVEQTYRRADIVRFEPLNPVTPGHMLFVPMDHVEQVENGAWFALGRAMEVAHEYGWEQKEDFNLITSSGASATQTVPHMHTHYIPRHTGDGLTLPWTGQA